MGTIKYYLVVALGRDAAYHPALCFSMEGESWYLFQDNMGLCFRHVKETVASDYTSEEIKRQKFGVYREMTQKWNKIASILKTPGED